MSNALKTYLESLASGGFLQPLATGFQMAGQAHAQREAEEHRRRAFEAAQRRQGFAEGRFRQEFPVTLMEALSRAQQAKTRASAQGLAERQFRDEQAGGGVRRALTVTAGQKMQTPTGALGLAERGADVRALQAESEGQGVRYAGRKAGTEQEAREAAKLRAFHQRALAQENERRAQAGEKLPPDARRAPLSGSQLTDEQLARRVQVNLAQAAGRQLLEDPYAAPLNTVLKAYDTDFSKRSIINHVPAEQRTNPQILVRYAKILKRIGREAEALDLVAAAIQADEALTTQLLSAE